MFISEKFNYVALSYSSTWKGLYEGEQGGNFNPIVLVTSNLSCSLQLCVTINPYNLVSPSRLF